VPRLIDLGVEPFLLPATLHLIIAQRLVRRLCRACRVPVADPAAHLKDFSLLMPEDREVHLWQPKGCAECRQQGYRGRLAIFEMLVIDEQYHPLLYSGSVEQIKTLARSRGMPLLFEDGLRRAFSGDTSVEEVFRVAFAS
jgi:type II secretory ATPase GspE/PulE/Tfp pilus assembly ATPase PilB-like protein